MEILLNPNIAYLAIICAAMLAVITLIIPGTGLPELGLIICLSVSFYNFTHFPPDNRALLAVCLGILPFLAALRFHRQKIPLLLLAFLLFCGGSIFLFQNEWGIPLVNPWLAGFISLVCAGYLWIAVDKSIQIQNTRPLLDLEHITGKTGETRTAVHKNGSVQVGSELWSARSEVPIPAGTTVKIIKREGFTLIVEK